MKRFIILLLLSVFFVSSYSQVSARDDRDSIAMKVIRMDTIDPTDGILTKSELLSFADNMYGLQLKIDSNSKITWIYGQGIKHGEENTSIKGTVEWSISPDWKITWKITGYSRQFGYNIPKLWAWDEGICSIYDKRPFIEISWNLDRETKKIKIRLNHCNLVMLTFESKEPVIINSCEEDEVYVNEKCSPISDFCSKDDLVNYDVSTEKCYCPIGYKLTNKKTCEEVEEMVYQVSYPDEKPPFLMDGKAHRIKVNIKDWATEKSMKARFEIKYTNAPKQWNLTNIEELAVWEYILTYKTPVIEEWESEWRFDGLYIFYDSKVEWKEMYKTHELALGAGTSILIQKEWFQETRWTVIFTTPTADVKIITFDNEWKKVFISDAKITIWKTLDSERSDNNWQASLNSPETISTNKKQDILEIELFPSLEIKDFQQKALQQYRQSIQWKNPVTSEKVRLFIENFVSYIAALNEEDVDDAVVWLKRVGYTLLYMTEWKSLIEDIAQNTATSIKTQFTDTLDLIWASEKAGKYLWFKIDKNMDISKLQEFSPEILNKLWSLTAWLENKAKNTIKLGIKKYAPQFKTERADTMLSNVFGTYGRDKDIEKWVWEIQSVVEKEVETMLTDYLLEEFDTMLVSKMKSLEQMIDKKDFDIVWLDTDLYFAKYESLNLREKYMTAHRVSYNVSMIKNRSDLINNSIIEWFKITQFYAKQAEAIEKWYKAIRTVFLNTTETYYRLDAYGIFMTEVENNINRGIGLTYIPTSQTIQKTLIPQVSAEESELSAEQESQVYDYRWGNSIIEITAIINDINNLLLDIFPNDKNLEAIKQSLEQTVDQEQEILATFGEQIKIKSDLLQKELWEGHLYTGLVTFGDWLIILLTLGFLAWVAFLINKAIKKIRKK